MSKYKFKWYEHIFYFLIGVVGCLCAGILLSIIAIRIGLAFHWIITNHTFIHGFKVLSGLE